MAKRSSLTLASPHSWASTGTLWAHEDPRRIQLRIRDDASLDQNKLEPRLWTAHVCTRCPWLEVEQRPPGQEQLPQGRRKERWQTSRAQQPPHVCNIVTIHPGQVFQTEPGDERSDGKCLLYPFLQNKAPYGGQKEKLLVAVPELHEGMRNGDGFQNK